MLKINQIWDEENFQVRAGTCARYILHRIYKILKKKDDFFMFFVEIMAMNTFVSLGDIDMFSKRKMFGINPTFIQ